MQYPESEHGSGTLSDTLLKYQMRIDLSAK
jgi:hypothetical protein